MLGANFYRFAGTASLLSALSTLILIFAPYLYPPSEGIAGRMAMVENGWYQLRAWTYLLHPLLVFTAALGVGTLFWQRNRALALSGSIGFGVWAVTEAAQQCLTLFAFDRWRRAWLAGDEAVRQTIEIRTALYDGIWDAMYVLIVLAFFVGNLLFAAALARGARFDRLIAVFYLLAALLTLTIIVVEFGGPELVPEAIGPWVYPAIQPLGRVLIGLWLWHQARSGLYSAPNPAPTPDTP